MKLKYINYFALVVLVAIFLNGMGVDKMFDLTYDPNGGLYGIGSFNGTPENISRYEDYIFFTSIITNSILLWFIGQGIYQIIRLLKKKFQKFASKSF